MPPALYAEPRPGLSDEELLETIARQSFEYFRAEIDLRTGLVRDRANNFMKVPSNKPASIAATGFGLAAYGVAVERGWMDRATAHEMTRRTLEFFAGPAPHERGFYYHFMNVETGTRARQSEVSPIDTVLFLAGAFFAADYFQDPHFKDLVRRIYERIDFPWMLNGGDTLALSWSPEAGFSKWRWDHYDENMILYLFAIGSPAHPIPAASWKAIARPVGSYKGYRLIQMPPLFTHQYSHIWIDFRNKNDGIQDYFKNSVNASLANRAFAIDQAGRFASYGTHSWGLTASDGPFGYRAYGAPPGWAEHDGTIAPTGCGSSIVFTPIESIACLRHFYENLHDKLWGQYGFSDAFNLDKQWFDQEVIGIDQGALLLMIENYRSGLIWKIMSTNPFLTDAMEKAGFKPGSVELAWPDPPEYKVPYAWGGHEIDGFVKDWPSTGKIITLDRSFKETGHFGKDSDIRCNIRFAWNEKALYFFATITDDSVLLRKSGKNIWQDDLLELFIDPKRDGFYWEFKDDFQIGFRPQMESPEVLTWSWFAGEGDPQENGAVKARGYVDQKGYMIEGSIRWDYLGIYPEAGKEIGLSISLHDIDLDRSEGKLHWFFRSEEEHLRFMLGKIILGDKERRP